MTSRIDPSLIPVTPNLSFEIPFWQAGIDRVAGLDEAGRGAWAGPVAAAAVILPPDPEMVTRLAGVRDSKQLLPGQRSRLADKIKSVAADWAIGFASAAEIDRFGILFATRLAMQRALNTLGQTPGHLLIDALFLPEIPLPQTALVKGDQRSLSIAAASILAKTARDEWMIQLEDRIPGYGFARHKGYGTALHTRSLERLGPCDQHRLSFAPLHQFQVNQE